MFSGRLKRPSSARRNIKHETFSPFVSASRLRHVQGLLNDGTKATKDCPDAILCIGGIDSRYNDGMLELINYLLFGFFELRKAELEKSGFDEEIIDDVLLLIERERVHVYCNPINYHYLLPYVSHWRNVYFHCLTDTEYEDEEKAEDFKITTFVSIVKNCPKIGIPYSNSVHGHVFDKMVIEKWPIIQVYGVEGVGGGGFFTMIHDVEDVSEQVQQLYSLTDPVTLETIVIEQVSKFDRQWTTMISTVQAAVSSNSCITEEKIFEPLHSFYVHGRASGGGGDGVKVTKPLPYVLFGTNTCKQVLQGVMKGNHTQKTDLRATAVGSHGANFMVCKAVSPRGPISCLRTYFFTRELVNPFQDSKITSYEQNTDLRILTILYSAMIDAVISGIQAYSCTLSLKKGYEVAWDTLQECCTGIGDPVVSSYLKQRSQVEFSVQTVDNSGCCHDLREGDRSLLVKCATLTLYDIPSLEKIGSVVGSLQFSETFLDSMIQVRAEDGSIKLDGEYILLTDHIPRYQTWPYTSMESDRKQLQDKLEGDSLTENFGKLLLSGDPVHVGCNSPLCMPPEEAHLYAYENGLVIMSSQFGAVVFHGNHIKSAQFYDGDTSNTVAVLVIEYQPNFVPYIPFHLQSSDSELFLLFTPKSKAYKHLYSEVLHNWKIESEVPKVVRVDELPEQCYLLHTLVQHRHMSSAPSTKVKTALQKASLDLPYLYSFSFSSIFEEYTDEKRTVRTLIRCFLQHFNVSSAGWYPIPEADLSKLLQITEDMTDTSLPDVEIVVTVLTGIPGSHQDKLCDVLSGLSKDQNRYVVLKPPVDASQPFNPLDIQAKLKATLNVHRRRKQGQLLSRNTRVLYIVPGYTDVVSAVQAIENHPDPDVRSHCSIGSVTACVDPVNTFMENKFVFPYLLSACAQGWVNQIIMTSSTSLQNEYLEDIQVLLRAVNTDVAFLLAEKGQVSRSMDLDAILSESSFGDAAKVRARFLSCPGWLMGSCKPDRPLISAMMIQFSLPLDRHKMANKLRGLKSALTPYPFSGNVYNVQGKVKFIGPQSDETQEVHFTTLTKALDIRPVTDTAKDRAQNRGCFLTFLGCDLNQDQLKNWLRECAPKKPEKKSFIARKDITREEVKKLHSEHHLDPLPEGWFYNGTQYVSFDGSKQDRHPNLEDFIRDHIDKKNAVIRDFNIKVDELADSYKDLFS